MRRLLAFLLAVPLPVGAQQTVTPTEVRPLDRWRDPALHESSGVAVSHRYPGVLWTHNDSGDGPYLYATDTTGTLRASFAVTGANAVDWEDIALGPCIPEQGWDGRTCLFIGDIGDNDERRNQVVIYAVPEPDPSSGAARAPTSAAHALAVRYPDGPHDAEALVVLPDGRLDIVTKGRSGAVLRFEIPASAWAHGDLEAPDADTLPITPAFFLGRWVTGAAAAPDGRTVVVRTYTEIYRFEIGPRWRLLGPACVVGLIEPQGEGVDFLDATHLVLTSETAWGSTGGLTIVQCP
jgi:hypothetical protein